MFLETSMRDTHKWSCILNPTKWRASMIYSRTRMATPRSWKNWTFRPHFSVAFSEYIRAVIVLTLLTDRTLKWFHQRNSTMHTKGLQAPYYKLWNKLSEISNQITGSILQAPNYKLWNGGQNQESMYQWQFWNLTLFLYSSSPFP